MARFQSVVALLLMAGLTIFSCSKMENPVAAPGSHQSGKIARSSQINNDFGYIISGTVFVDADEDTVLDNNESGVAGVSVILETYSEGAQVDTVSTDASGNYSFTVDFTDTFVVRVELNGVLPNDFNEKLDDFFEPTTSLQLSLIISEEEESGAEFPDNNFGFTPDTDQIIEDLESNQLETNGRDFKFWRKQLLFAWNRGKGSPEIPTETILQYLDGIEELLLHEPYQFKDSNEARDAWEIVQKNPKKLIDKLKKELLIAELNYFDQRGLVNNLDLQLSIMAWGESLVAEVTSSAPNQMMGKPASAEIAAVSNTTLTTAVKIFTSFNSSGGGGGVGD